MSDWLSSDDPVIVTIPKLIRRTAGVNVETIPDPGPPVHTFIITAFLILQAATISRKPNRSTLVVVVAVVVVAAAVAAGGVGSVW